MKSFVRFIVQLLGWIIRIILILWVILGIYLLYQNVFNNRSPKEVLSDLQWTVQQTTQSIQQEVSSTVTMVSGWPQVCYLKDCYSIEIVDTPASRQKWLMFREELDTDAGMLFVFDTPSNYNFWMKNTKLSLDMIWLDKNFKILYINANTPPCTKDPCPTYGPEQAAALYVLEINGWQAANWMLWDTLTVKNL